MGGGLEVGEVKTPSAPKSEGETLVNRSNNEPDTSTRNLNIKHEFLNIIERGDKLITPSQLIDPSDLITANLINPKAKNAWGLKTNFTKKVIVITPINNEVQSF